jgi:hypothetical protein
MALNTDQIRALRRANFDEDSIDCIFSQALSQSDWKDAVRERESAVLKDASRNWLGERGVAWKKNNNLLSVRLRNMQLQALSPDAIPILMLNDGRGWVPEPLLRHLACRQFGIKTQLPLEWGVITSKQVIQEWQEKMQASMHFAQLYIEPLEVTTVTSDWENLSKEEYRRIIKVVKNAPGPKHPQRHALAEGLVENWRQIAEQIVRLEKGRKAGYVARWIHLLSRVFEAGKSHAYLERDKDPLTLAENRKGSRMVGKHASSGRKVMEEAFADFLGQHKRHPKIGELRQWLNARRICPKDKAKPHIWVFADQL